MRPIGFDASFRQLQLTIPTQYFSNKQFNGRSKERNEGDVVIKELWESEVCLKYFWYLTADWLVSWLAGWMAAVWLLAI